MADLFKVSQRVDADERRLALQWMCSLGGAAEALLESLTLHPFADVRDESAKQLQRIAINRRERESWLVEKRPLPLPPVATLVETLDLYQGSQKWAVEERFRDAIIQIGLHGPLAQPAIESIRALTNRENPWIRGHAIRALWRITRNPDLVVPLLQANLDPHPPVFLILDCLQQIGTAAQATAPNLRQILHSERRFFRQGWVDPCGLDEAFCQACAAALQEIEVSGAS